MNKVAYQYTIVRFAPFVETGEFANVGIVMFSPKTKYFAFELKTGRYGRITKFFDELDRKFYLHTIQPLKEELQRINDLLDSDGFNNTAVSQQLFDELIRPRETIVRFSEPRVVLADNPVQKIRDLFAYYVERNFVTKEYVEKTLEKGIGACLKQAQLDLRFQRLDVGDGEYQANFPFVEQKNNRPVKVIKPLHLGQDKPSKIIDHGGQWLFRLEELKRRECLPEKVLLTVAGPENATAVDALKRQSAYQDTVARLEDTGVEVTQYRDQERILNFARS